MPEERKLVTILFADVTGSTALADTLDPEDVRALMSRYYDHARRVITPCGGTLEKFIGDAVMAIFGLYQAHEDDPERALASALALREAVASDEILNPVFRLRIGVNTGEVVATDNPDRLDFLVTGDAVNVSARLQQGANPGEVIVSQRTADATCQAFHFAEPRLLQAKGKPEPLRIFPLQGKRATRMVKQHPFVGRIEELRQLEMIREQVQQEQRAHTVTIVGPAGTGKSRLLAELLARIKPEEGMRIASAPCLPYGETLTYWPLRGLLTALLGRPPEKEQIQSIYEQGGYDRVDAGRLAQVLISTLTTQEAEDTTDGDNPLPSSTSMPVGLKLNLSDDEAIDLFKGMGKKMLANVKQPDFWKRLHLSGNRRKGQKPHADQPDDTSPARPTPFQLEAFLDGPDGLAALDEIDVLSNLTDPPTLQERERIEAFGERMRMSSEALKLAINESVYSTLREVVPSRFLATDRESLFTAWRLLLNLLARQAPRIIIFDDLHWASDALLNLVENLAQQQMEAPILFVLQGRPELFERRRGWLTDHEHMNVLVLPPLAETETQELLERARADVPAHIKRQIIERAGGNPFFTLELLRGYTERVERGESGDALTLPDTVHGAILARIDLLSPRERSLLQVASISKGTISRPWLMALMGEQDLNSALQGLQSRDMLLALGNGNYTFRHVLIHDVAYGTMARPERIRLHGQTALWLEDTSDSHNEYTELSAYHYRKAIELARQSAVPLALPFKIERAVKTFERAGLHSGRSSCFSDAFCYLQLAIDLAPPSEHARLYEALAENVSNGNASFEAYQKALASWRAEPVRQSEVGARLIRKLLMQGTRYSLVSRFTMDEVTALQQEALILLEGTDNEDERWRLRLAACFDSQSALGSPDSTKEMKQVRLDLIKQRRKLAEQAASYFEQRQYWEALSEALDAYGVLAISSYSLPEALAAQERRLSIPELPIVEWADAVSSVICCLFLMGNYDGCITSVHETFANLKPGQPVARLGRIVSYGMLAAYLSGRWKEVETLLPRLDEIHELVVDDSASSSQLVRGYHAMLLVALAREDHTLVEKISARLRQDAKYLEPFFLSAVDALIADDAQQLSQPLPAHIGGDTLSTALMLFANEHGYALPKELLALVKDTGENNRSLLDIAHALAANDIARLAQAITEAAAHHLEHHAARMRIILSSLSHDPGPLDLARPVLERLGDHQFLRRLAKVEQEIYV